MRNGYKAKSRLGNVLMIAGLVVCLIAALIYVSTTIEEKKAEESSAYILEKIQEQITETTVSEEEYPGGYIPTEPTESIDEDSVVVVNNVSYLGYLSFPAFDRTLPVIADWDFNMLQQAPVRYYGSVATGDLVIAAHNYRTHFNILSDLEKGDEVLFTDATGKVIRYTVQLVETLNPTDIAEMQAGKWDLTLFTCTPGGQARVTVRCARKA